MSVSVYTKSRPTLRTQGKYVRGVFYAVLGMKKALLLVADVLKNTFWANDFSSTAHKKALTLYMLQYSSVFYNPHFAIKGWYFGEYEHKNILRYRRCQ